jgi:UDP-3-O-[3-hydroxymyristoyl] N-acetylglucosamine deacetylase
MRAGHAMHTALVARLVKDRSAWELAHVPVTPSPANESQTETDSGVAQAALAGA